MSSCTTTVPNSVRKSEPVGQTSRQGAFVQCLQTSDDISHRKPSSSSDGGTPRASRPDSWTRNGFRCSIKATWRQESAPKAPVLSYELPVSSMRVAGTSFHSLQATSQALQPMQTVGSVKKLMRGCPSW